MNKEPLAGLKTTALEHVGPDREKGFGQAGGLLQPHAVGDRQAMRGGRGHVFGIAAPGQQRTNPVARHPVIHTIAQGHDLARRLEPRQIARSWRRRIKPRTLQRIGPVHPGPGHLDHHLAGSRHGDGARCGLQHVRPARPGDLHRGHRLFHVGLLTLVRTSARAFRVARRHCPAPECATIDRAVRPSVPKAPCCRANPP